jgi:hypothetical protein
MAGPGVGFGTLYERDPSYALVWNMTLAISHLVSNKFGRVDEPKGVQSLSARKKKLVASECSSQPSHTPDGVGEGEDVSYTALALKKP